MLQVLHKEPDAAIQSMFLFQGNFNAWRDYHGVNKYFYNDVHFQLLLWQLSQW